MRATSIDDRYTSSYTRLYPTVLRYAARRVGRDVADDVAAETFLAAWRIWERAPLGDDEMLVKWLCSIARYKALHAHRADRRHVRLVAQLAAELKPPVNTPGEALEALSLSPELQGAVAALPACERSALFLVAIVGMQHSEAGAVLGCSTGAIGNRLMRARRNVASRLTVLVTMPEELETPGSSRG